MKIFQHGLECVYIFRINHMNMLNTKKKKSPTTPIQIKLLAVINYFKYVRFYVRSYTCSSDNKLHRKMRLLWAMVYHNK